MQAVTGRVAQRQLRRVDDFGDLGGEHPDNLVRTIAREARDAFYHSCRFVFATRPYSNAFRENVFELQPISPETASQMIVQQLGDSIGSGKNYLQSLFSAPIPVSFVSDFLDASRTRDSLGSIVDQNCRTLLKADEGEHWNSWQRLLAFAALKLYLDSPSQDASANSFREQIPENLISEIKRLDSTVTDAYTCLRKMSAAGLLHHSQAGWSFTHPGITHYFAARYIAIESSPEANCEIVGNWNLAPFSRRFLPVITYLREMKVEVARLGQAQIPIIWEAELKGKVPLPSRIVHRKAEYVLIPGGRFKMGTTPARIRDLRAQAQQTAGWPTLFDSESPATDVELNDFYVSRFPVTNREYEEFTNECDWPIPYSDSPGSQPYNWDPVSRRPPLDQLDYPVVNVSWNDALRYCEWRGCLRLPTEAEWERAARSIDGREWPWGDWKSGLCNSEEEHRNTITPVGTYSPMGDSVEGVSDLAGNVQEWCSSLWSQYPYDPRDGRENLKASGQRVVRGGAFTQPRWKVRSAFRHKCDASDCGFSIGFRTVLTSWED